MSWRRLALKEASDWVALIRLVMYDIIGLLVPGLVLLYLIAWISGETLPTEFPAWGGGTTSAVAQAVANLVAAYVLGYLLQSISYVHLGFLEPLGLFLLGKKEQQTKRGDVAVSAATTLARRYFEDTSFYKVAKEQIARAAGINDFEKLTYSDIENLAFSIAPDETDKARHFRFRGDLCGALSTLALFGFLGAVVVALKFPDIFDVFWPLVWCGVGWIMLLGFVLGYPRNWRETRKGQVARVTLLLALFSSLVGIVWWASGKSPSTWVVPALFGAWFFFLHRSYFYKDIGSRVVFYIGVAEVMRLGKTEKKAS
jgi:hypothetical protein